MKKIIISLLFVLLFGSTTFAAAEIVIVSPDMRESFVKSVHNDFVNNLSDYEPVKNAVLESASRLINVEKKIFHSENQEISDRVGPRYDQIVCDAAAFAIRFDVESKEDFMVIEGDSIELSVKNVIMDYKHCSPRDFYAWTATDGGFVIIDDPGRARAVRYFAPEIDEKEKKVKLYVDGGDAIGFARIRVYEIRIIGRDNPLAKDLVTEENFFKLLFKGKK